MILLSTCTSLVAQLILRWDTCVHNLPRVPVQEGRSRHCMGKKVQVHRSS